jgi:hypothetical protein
MSSESKTPILTQYNIPTRNEMVKIEKDKIDNAEKEFEEFVLEEISRALKTRNSTDAFTKPGYVQVDVTSPLFTIYHDKLSKICEFLTKDYDIFVNIYRNIITLVWNKQMINEFNQFCSDVENNRIELNFIKLLKSRGTEVFKDSELIGNAIEYANSSVLNEFKYNDLKLYRLNEKEFSAYLDKICNKNGYLKYHPTESIKEGYRIGEIRYQIYGEYDILNGNKDIFFKNGIFLSYPKFIAIISFKESTKETIKESSKEKSIVNTTSYKKLN